MWQARFSPGGARPPTKVLNDFIDKHCTHGVEPICKALQIALSGYWRHAALLRAPGKRCARAHRDDILTQRSDGYVFRGERDHDRP
jgi:hypothetical protein